MTESQHQSKEDAIEELIYWLRNGNEDDGPFVHPQDILKAAPYLVVNYYHPSNKPESAKPPEVTVEEPSSGVMVWAPLNARCEIVWEDWSAVGEIKWNSGASFLFQWWK